MSPWWLVTTVAGPERGEAMIRSNKMLLYGVAANFGMVVQLWESYACSLAPVPPLRRQPCGCLGALTRLG
jgi:hypothetical protein